MSQKIVVGSEHLPPEAELAGRGESKNGTFTEDQKNPKAPNPGKLDEGPKLNEKFKSYEPATYRTIGGVIREDR